jgi:hypothetical protein
MADRGWSHPFDDPIPVPKGKPLITLRDAATYITKLPKAEQDHERWQTAIACLIGAAESRDFIMHARIGMLRALNHATPKPAVAPRRKSAKAYRIVP